MNTVAASSATNVSGIRGVYSRFAHLADLLQSPFLLLVRLYWGGQFIQTGWGKLHNLGHVKEFFTSLGIPAPAVMAPAISMLEFVGGILLIVGLVTRFATIPLLIDIGVAIATTKVPMLLHQGFWPAMHEGRTDFCMVLGLIAILCIGPGRISCDAKRFMDGE